MYPTHPIFNRLRPIKRQIGYLVNRTTEKWCGRHLALRDSFPYFRVTKPRFLTVRLDAINKCNLRCQMCYFSLDEIRNLPLSEMSLQLFQKIAAEVFPLTHRLILSAGAEPLLAKYFPAMLEIAAQYDLPQMCFTTNGMLLDERKIEQIIRAGVEYILVSFDGATPQTYESIRRGANFDRVLGNIQLLQKLKKHYRSLTPAIHFSTVLMRSNIEEFPEIIRLAKDLGVAQVEANHLVPYHGLDMQQETLNHYKRLANTYFDQARQLAQTLKVALIAPPNFSESDSQALQHDTQSNSARKRCQWPWHELIINPEGTVYPCCYWFETTSMGNFQTQSFQEIWEGQEYQQLREELTTNSLREICRNCPIRLDCNNDQIFSEVRIRRGV